MRNRTQIFLCDLTYTQQSISSDVMPAAIGCLAAYLKKHGSHNYDIRLFKYPEKLIEAIEHAQKDEGRKPKIIGFSNYEWNCNLSLAFAKEVKSIFDDVIIVLGGPNFPSIEKEQINFFNDNGFIDFYIQREGEHAFCLLVDTLIRENFRKDKINYQEIANLVIWNGEKKQLKVNSTIERVSLEDVPSPYAEGLMDEFFDNKLIPIVQTIRGCPFSCTFCTEGSIYWSKIKKGTRERTDQELEYIARKIVELDYQRRDMHIADSNFGMYQHDFETAQTLSRLQCTHGFPKFITSSTGKNNKKNLLEISKILNGALRFGASVQSLNEGVLENIKRKNIDVDEIMELCQETSDIDNSSFSEIIVNLPGDTIDLYKQTLKILLDSGFDFVVSYQAILLLATEMASEESRKQYGFSSRFRVIPRCIGEWTLLGRTVKSVESQEIIISQNSFSYRNYIEARKIGLIVEIFYNFGVFKRVLKRYQVNRISVMELISDALAEGVDASREFSKMLDRFISESESELYESKEALQKFVLEENISKFIDGKMGSNLVFKYKVLSLTECLDEIKEILLKLTEKIFIRHNIDKQEIEFAKELIIFDYLKLKNIFTSDRPNKIEHYFRYDPMRYFDTFIENENSGNYLYIFSINHEQIEMLKKYHEIYGNDFNGLSRFISKIGIRMFFREIERVE